jgi:hypothetical protein
MKENSQNFCQHLIPDIQQNSCSSSRRKRLNDILWHLENAVAHNTRLFSETIESVTAQRVPHPSDGPDPAPNSFFLFGYLKEKLRGTLFASSDDVIFARLQIFSEIPEMGLKNVFTD